MSDYKSTRVFVNGEEIDLNNLTSGGNGGRPPRWRGRLAGCLLFVVIVLIVAIPLLFLFGDRLGIDMDFLTQAMSGGRAPLTEPVPGDATAFDPIAAYDEAAAFAGEDAGLTGFRATYVRSDGTIDLTATFSPVPMAHYDFLVPVERPADAPPLGAPGVTSDGQWYQPVDVAMFQPGQLRTFSSRGGGGNVSIQYIHEGMSRTLMGSPTTDIDLILPPPTCNFARLWEFALGEGAPENAVASIRYDEDGYRFTINLDERITLRFDMDCNLIE